MPAIIIMPHELIPEGQTYHPLSPSLRSGLMAISVLALISFIVSATLFFYLTYKLVAWHFFVRRRCKTLKREQQQRKQLHEEEEERQRQMKDRDAEMQEHHKRDSAQEAMDFTLGIDGIFTKGQTLPPKPQTPDKPVSQQHVPEKCHQIKPYSSPPNQFLLLIYNLLLADLHQGMAFALNASWLRRDGIMVGTPTCWTQGFFVSTGDLGSSMFITLIAIHTYMSVVLGYRPSQKTVYNAIISVWIFVYVISLIPIGTTRNGAAVGGFFVRAGSWVCADSDFSSPVAALGLQDNVFLVSFANRLFSVAVLDKQGVRKYPSFDALSLDIPCSCHHLWSLYCHFLLVTSTRVWQGIEWRSAGTARNGP